MDTGTFMDIVASRYKEIRSLFKTRLYNSGLQFDEDLFNDTFIKCVNKFGNDEITYDVTVKYFWTAYFNTIKSELIKESYTEPLDEELHDCLDDNYNEYTDEDFARDIYNKVSKAVKDKFGADEATIYMMYKYHNWKECDLIAAGYSCHNLTDRIKTMHRFVKAYCKKNIVR